MNGLAGAAGATTRGSTGLACTGGEASDASNAGRVTGRPWTGGLHGASGVADCGNGGGRLEAGRRIGLGGGADGSADAGRRIGAGGGPEDGAPGRGAVGATLVVASPAGRLRFGGGGGWLMAGRAWAPTGGWLGIGRWGGGGAADWGRRGGGGGPEF
ncbi:MAG TPA: hypothetical protein VHM25_01655 [Polyangiaceae bacterium]|nr:hypothetical protein [Polyangiaceae bacterium]